MNIFVAKLSSSTTSDDEKDWITRALMKIEGVMKSLTDYFKLKIEEGVSKVNFFFKPLRR